MGHYSHYNPNPANRSVGDCTIRAISKALNQSWDKTYVGLCVQGFEMGDMPSGNSVWGAYLKKHGFSRSTISNDCPDCYTVSDFADDHTDGTYILALSGHVVAVIDGQWFDSWDSGNEIPLFYWCKK